tara:strand:+ start:531 stop:1673 length:1143 start_codon:yes stop_codon:yes gene_type:complete
MNLDKLSQILDHQIFNTPSSYEDKEIPFTDKLQQSLTDYCSYFKVSIADWVTENVEYSNGRNSSGEIMSERISEVSDILMSVIKYYLSGDLNEAIKGFEFALNRVSIEKTQPIEILRATKKLYRARKDEAFLFTKKDLFHVPFNLRHKIKTQRFSYPGFPALYCGGSSYICWEELDREKFDSLWFTEFELNKDLNVIELLRKDDLIKKIALLTEDMVASKMAIVSFLTLFPINLACTIRAKYPDAPFKFEYIMPQLLMLYIIKNENVDGIKYPSTKINYSKVNGIDAYNYSFPVKSDKKIGYCNVLTDKLKYTEPTSLYIEQILQAKEASFSSIYGPSDGSQLGRTLELIEGDSRLYAQTSFAKLEDILGKKTKDFLVAS